MRLTGFFGFDNVTGTPLWFDRLKMINELNYQPVFRR